MQQPVTLSAADVARDFFSRDLAAREHSPDDAPQATVILHDACYGHRYSRPRTSKGTLSTIVERPERILASVIGISAAYVRLGGRHSAGRHPPRLNESPAQVPFAIKKSSRSLSLTSQAVTLVHGTRWMAELKSMCENAEAKLAMNGKELARPSVGAPEKRLHEGDLYLCAGSLDALEGALGGVLDAVDAAFAPSGPQRAFACVRPPGHHCSADFPSGFCWINNVHVGIAHAASTHGLTHAAVIDFDLHHGDGSQTIAWQHNAKAAASSKNLSPNKKYPIGYFSLHDINSYPCEFGDEDKVQNASLCIEGAHGQTVWNVHLQPWKTNAEFWRLYEDRYLVVLEKARGFLRAQAEKLRTQPQPREPKAAIFISAGFDASEWEGAGMQRHKVNVPTDFYARFTQDIVKLSHEAGLAVDGRVISVLEGGYSDRALMTGALSHLCGLTAPHPASESGSLSNGLAYDLSNRMKNLEVQERSTDPPTESHTSSFDGSWWSPPFLDELDRLMNPAPAPAVRKPRGPTNPTYTTPTQSYNAKVVSPSAARRSTSNPISYSQSPSILNIPPPPPPDVSWDVATYELSKLLIPTDRPTFSCKHEDLNTEATKARRARQSAVGVVQEAPPEGEPRMQLRDRRAKAPVVQDTQPLPKPQQGANANRRRTISGASETLEQGPGLGDQAMSFIKPRPAPRRRVSTASTLASTTEDSTLASSTSKPDLDQAPTTNAPPKPRGTKKAGSKSTVAQGGPGSRPSSKGRAGPTNAALPKPAKPQKQAQSAARAEPDVDALASGVKKMSIKLNVPSKEEQARREAERLAASQALGRPLAAKPPKVERTTPSEREPLREQGIQNGIAQPVATKPEPPADQTGQHTTSTVTPASTHWPTTGSPDQAVAPNESSSGNLPNDHAWTVPQNGPSQVNEPSDPSTAPTSDPSQVGLKRQSMLFTPGSQIIFGASKQSAGEEKIRDENSSRDGGH